MPATTKTVRFYLQRHGAWDPETGKLTLEGIEQVTATARKHFGGVDFVAGYSSGMTRTDHTVITAASVHHSTLQRAIRTSPAPIRRDEFFGYLFAENISEGGSLWTFEAFLEAITIQKKAGRKPMLDTVLNQWQTAQVIRWALLCTMKHLAEHLVTAHLERNDLNILVGTHATAHCAAQNPAVTPSIIEPGCAVQYTWQVDDNNYAELKTSRILTPA